MRANPVADARGRPSTVHQPTRSTRGASSASTCSRAARSPVAAMWSTSSNSRCASNSPVCGRTLSTQIPVRASAAVISVSGIAPAGSSTTRSSTA
ncbi:hypothetical protein C1Y40_02796 [Mycobacterium talmoniae]|uniref:Uncharacterized protein n=1 Tax=Mycobacterium talmoniae TaxID=1858794 RepID=A0A2S8BK06_9MYCO|nr:hypothetical protein C1Y40_02796 [Mycobacterium talmoniae]